jgi:putative transposase
VCGAGYGERTPERVNSRNGYRHRDLDTRVGTLDVAVPKLRTGSLYPEWLLERRKRAERALTSVVRPATCSGSVPAGSTGRPFTFVAADALVLKVREGGRVVPVHVLVATGVNADGHREILGVQVTSSEDGAGWLAFFRDLTARGLAPDLVEQPQREGSTARSAAAPTSWASFPTGPASSDSSAPSSPRNTTSGPKDAATSDSTSWLAPRPSTPAPSPRR